MRKLASLFIAWMAALLTLHAQDGVRVDSLFSEYTTAHGHSYIKIACPVTDNPEFNASIIRRLKEVADGMLVKESVDSLQELHPSNPQELKAYNDLVCQHLATALGWEWEEDVLKDMEDDSEDNFFKDVICEHTLEFSVINDHPRYLCACFVDYGYYGGVHGFTGIFPMIVRKSDGKFLSTPFREDNLEELRVLLKTNMRKDDFGLLELDGYGPEDADQRKEIVEMIRSYDSFPEPENAWTDGKQFFIQYQQYEIMPYAYGAPLIIVPMDIIRPYLTDEVLELLEQNDN